MQCYVPGTRIVKIREGRYIVYAEHRGVKTVRFILEIEEEKMRSAILSRDFFVAPPEALRSLEQRIEGLSVLELLQRIESITALWFSTEVKSSVGLEPQDIVNVVKKAIETYFARA